MEHDLSIIRFLEANLNKKLGAVSNLDEAFVPV
jgi:hypothetical protein